MKAARGWLPFLLALLMLAASPAAQAQKGAKFQASAIQVLYVKSEEVRLPPEFQAALYENLVEEVKKTQRFPRVLRDGERGATEIRDLIILRSAVRGFRQGSAMVRQVTTIAGATKITVRVQMATRDGRLILDEDVEGNVRFFGENLRATHDFAKQVAKLIRQNF